MFQEALTNNYEIHKIGFQVNVLVLSFREAGQPLSDVYMLEKKHHTLAFLDVLDKPIPLILINKDCF